MSKTLLLADDSVTIQKVVGITFANEDVELVTVDNGDDALARAKEVHPDLIMADIGMPGLTGYELCAAVRGTPEIGHVPVLLLTGTFETYDEKRANEVGANGHISKPFEAQALVDRVYALLDEAEAGQGATAVSEPLPAPAPPAAAPTSTAPAPAYESASSMLPEIPELPNSSFRDLAGLGQTAPGGDLPSAEVPDLLLPATREPRDAETGPPNTEIFGAPSGEFGAAPTQDSAPPAATPLDAGHPPPSDSSDGETAFLDPLAAGPAWHPRGDPGVGSQDADTDDAQGDTNPMYADGTPIPRDSGGHTASPSLDSFAPPAAAPLVPEVPELPAFNTPEPGASSTARQFDTEPIHAAPAAQDPWSTVPSPPVTLEPGPADIEPEEITPEPLPPEDTGYGETQAEIEALPQAEALPEIEIEPEDEPIEPLRELQENEADVFPASAGTTAPLPPQIDPDAVHGAIEKIAWEAFGSLSQELVEQFTSRMEAIIWEVVPQIAERLVRDEIERLKDGES
jgi:CheY-like chemotaxis protein